jgi:hypothetical protein
MGAAKAHEVITVGATVIGFTAANVASYTTNKAKPPERAVCVLETGAIRIRWDASAANVTSVAGHKINVGDVFEVEGETDLQNFRAVAVNATSGSLTVTYES